jgi:uncharacterized membrane protein
MHQRLTTILLAGLVLGTNAFAGDNDKKVILPPTPPEDSWQFKLSMPGWIPWLEGDTGINGITSHVALGPDTIVPKVDMIADVRMEAHKGRFSMLGEFLYMSLSDGIGSNTVVKKIDVQVDQIMGDLGVAWRIIDSPRGYLDVIGGVRYTNLFQQLVTQPGGEHIGEASTQLVDAVSERIATALPDGALRNLIAAKLPEVPELGHPSTLPIAPIGGRLQDSVRERIRQIIDARKTALAAAVQARAQAVGAAAQAAAQQRVDAIKNDLSKKIARTVESKLDARVARTDDWFDPYVGLRGRYNLSERFYLTGKGDIGGFGVGADLTWTAEAALGCQLTRNIFAEAGYRALGVDYEQNGLTYDMITHGPQITLGINF